MTNSAITIHYITDILSFNSSTKALEKTISSPTFNWDNIVIEGSKHLVLPAIYCRLKAKKLLHTLPTDLVDYLEEITNINRARNTRILNQVHTITQVLNTHNIDHVFLKGTALLASDCYEDNGERMVGDIDILIEKSRVLDALNLLKNSGYNRTSGFAYDKKDFRHLDRLINENELAAIELHTELLNKKHWSLMEMPSILKKKRFYNNIAIPDKKDLSTHLLLSWQLNDHGHYYNTASLKSIYDLIVIETHQEQDNIKTLLKLKYGQSYLELAKYYFEEFARIPSNNYMRFRKFSFKTKESFKLINTISYLFKYSTFFISERLYLILTNYSYTKHILKKIRNKN
ncbi:nucleotidyltransferase family protein [Winogradskyella undariae]|uniref:nucleotidyltransferase family protein n=1 Tax=Winogradskyella undariae TaxID=1285465 RepID=UPI00156A9420|nr:nucleotidyltransferase family protein [Winogradskyella undariae]NRR91003.1 nucleotidyltransferase family protein [Winogradskyella undariae]